MSENRIAIIMDVCRQIEEDVYMEDYTAIEQLLSGVSTEDLVEYLPEETIKYVKG